MNKNLLLSFDTLNEQCSVVAKLCNVTPFWTRMQCEGSTGTKKTAISSAMMVFQQQGKNLTTLIKSLSSCETTLEIRFRILRIMFSFLPNSFIIIVWGTSSNCTAVEDPRNAFFAALDLPRRLTEVKLIILSQTVNQMVFF